MRQPNDLYTVVSEELVTAIRHAAARAGSMTALAREMGINERRIRTVLCQRVVSLTWLDRFCASGMTDLWATDFEWKTWVDLMDELDPEYREGQKRGPNRLTPEERSASARRSVNIRWERYRARKLHEQSDGSAESVASEEPSSSSEGFRPWEAGDGPRTPDADQGDT